MDNTANIDVWWSDSDLSDSPRHSIDCKNIRQLKKEMRKLYKNGAKQIIGYVRYPSDESMPNVDFLFKNGLLVKESTYVN